MIDLANGFTEDSYVLDYGFIRLVDCMPRYCAEGETADHTVCRSARVSYDGHKQKGRSFKDERNLIRYLMRHRHTSPFEMVEFTFHVKAPIFVARQWMRHRTGSFNEISARYSVLPEEFYLPTPDDLQKQSSDNKQGRNGAFEREEASGILFAMKSVMSQSHSQYQHLLGKSLSRELARTILPVSTYTEFYWKVDLLNLLKFLHLRMDKHAQHEIQVYAQSIAKVVNCVAPWSYEAFNDYWVNAPDISSTEWAAIVGTLTDDQKSEIVATLNGFVSKRELAALKCSLKMKDEP